MAGSVTDDRWGSRSAMNLPALTVTPRAMVESLDRVTGRPLSQLVDWQADDRVQAIVGSWPARFSRSRAAALGLEPERDFDAIVAAYLTEIKPG